MRRRPPIPDLRESVIRAKGPTRTYRNDALEVQALRGEFIVILGPSGSGKSTFLNIAGGLERASSGEAWFEDHELASLTEARLTRSRRDHVGFVFQFYKLVPSLTARENVELVTEIARAPMSADRALAGRTVGPGGPFPRAAFASEQQRVVIARAIAKNPEVLLCDEQTGALDSTTGMKVLEALTEANRAVGTTTSVVARDRRAGLGPTEGALSERVYDNAARKEKTARAAVASAPANLAVREKELESALAVLSLDRTGPATACRVEILAPVSGRVLRVLRESEQVVQPGTPILELGDPGNMEIVVELLSRDAVRVAEGARATVSGRCGALSAARVERVEPAAVTRVSALGIEAQRVTVILALEGAAADWKHLGHGFRVTASIAIWQQDEVLTIPVGALFRDGPDWSTYLLSDGRVVPQIVLCERNETYAQVLDGLRAGDQVILHPSDRVAEGLRAVALSGG